MYVSISFISCLSESVSVGFVKAFHFYVCRFIVREWVWFHVCVRGKLPSHALTQNIYKEHTIGNVYKPAWPLPVRVPSKFPTDIQCGYARYFNLLQRVKILLHTVSTVIVNKDKCKAIMGSERIVFAWSLKDSRLNCFTRLALLL